MKNLTDDEKTLVLRAVQQSLLRAEDQNKEKAQILRSALNKLEE